MAGWVIVVEFGTGAMQPYVFGTYVTEGVAQKQADAWEQRVAHTLGYASPAEIDDFATQVVRLSPKAVDTFGEAYRRECGRELLP